MVKSLMVNMIEHSKLKMSSGLSRALN